MDEHIVVHCLPDNGGTYRSNFDTAINVDQNTRIALTEVRFNKDYNIMHNVNAVFVDITGNHVGIKVPNLHYVNVNHLVDVLMDSFKRALDLPAGTITALNTVGLGEWLKDVEQRNRKDGKTKLPPDYTEQLDIQFESGITTIQRASMKVRGIFFTPELVEILGLQQGKLDFGSSNEIIGIKKPVLDPRKMLFLECDNIEPTYYNGQKRQLLKTIDLKNHEETVSILYPRPTYHKLISNEIERFQFKMIDEMGRSIKTQSPAMFCLHVTNNLMVAI